jgi:alpha-1,6-mannosyltransferase
VRPRPALAAGLATACLVGAASLLAWRAGSPLVPRDGGTREPGSAWLFLVLLVGAFACYLAGLLLVRRVSAPLRAVAVVAVLVQLVPLAAPLLLSTDAWTYWGYGWIAADGGGNPYVDPPSDFPQSPAAPYVGAAWRDTTTVYGPVFTGLSEPVAEAAGSSSDAAAWLYKTLAALAILAACVAVAQGAGRPALAVAFVGWNPVLAVHAAGGGHNDALVGGLAALAVALALRRRHDAAGVLWVLAVLVKWVPLLFLALASLAARARSRPLGARGIAIGALVLCTLATWLYGLNWLRAAEPLAGNAARETSYALPSRLEQLGLPHGLAIGLALAALGTGLVWLAREAARGHARLGLAACLVLATTPYLAVWYLAWAVPLAAPEEERASRLAALALTAYLLPQTIPL